MSRRWQDGLDPVMLISIRPNRTTMTLFPAERNAAERIVSRASVAPNSAGAARPRQLARMRSAAMTSGGP